MVGEAQEVTMDLAAAHAMAPDAKLVLHQVNVGTGEMDGDTLATYVDVFSDIIDNKAADVVSMSFGSPEGGDNADGNRKAFHAMAPVFVVSP
ncbi:hypothetical protein [Streptomyces sp. G1]|uniref:hypothetical protein n=1 Tax=Streptomyces sp. G1 TaxID=361572 RepID=UPI0020302730|nr:hypothetical protein [Streptomyces sp. G1]MCM1966296.1 hypothetical protein [Streptomyces sp. G1]